MNRKHIHYVLHYLALPILLIGSDIMIGIFGHYSGSTDDFSKIFSWGHIADYIMNSWQEILLVVGIALIVLVLVEYLIRDITAHNKRAKK